MSKAFQGLTGINLTLMEALITQNIDKVMVLLYTFHLKRNSMPRNVHAVLYGDDLLYNY